MAPLPNHDFRELFDTHVAFVWRVLRRHGVPEREVEDCCQEVFLVVHRRLDEFEHRSAWRTWIYGIAVRVAAAARRKANVTREQLGEVLPEAAIEFEPAQRIDQQAQLLSVERALQRLSKDKREVFALYELEGMTMANVAQALGIPENTALYRLYAARDEIRAFVERAQRPQRASRTAHNGRP